MATENNSNGTATSKKTFKEVHAEVKALPATKMKEVLSVLGSSSDQSFYDLLQGRRKIKSPALKEAIAKIYDKKPDEIDWQDAEQENAIA